jgi:hypothetical protein
MKSVRRRGEPHRVGDLQPGWLGDKDFFITSLVSMHCGQRLVMADTHNFRVKVKVMIYLKVKLTELII